MDASGYGVRYKSNRHSIYATIIVVALHLVFILMAIHAKSPKRNFQIQPSLQMFTLQKQSVHDVVPELPLIKFSPNSIQLTSFAPEFLDYTENLIDYSAPYELPDKHAEQYKDVFDPRLRKKLIEAQSLNRRKPEGSGGWTEMDGREFIEKGDGLCNVSMQNIDTHSKAKNWGFTRCGKTDSEKSMDRVMADYESHKMHP